MLTDTKPMMHIQVVCYDESLNRFEECVVEWLTQKQIEICRAATDREF